MLCPFFLGTQASPLNFWDSSARQALVPTTVNSGPLLDESVYPAAARTQDAFRVPPGSLPEFYPRVTNRKHVILIAEESFRVDRAENRTASATLAYLSRHRGCYRSDVHYAGCHVSEMGYFSLLYGCVCSSGVS